MIENEIKFELPDRESFLRLRDHFQRLSKKPAATENQLNHYLDTADLRLSRALVMLRLRDGKEKILTLKSGTRVEEGHFRARELEAALSEEEFRRVLEDPHSLYRLDLQPVAVLRREFGELPLRKIGSLANTRTRLEVEEHTVELDRMEFPGGREEYELEIEAEDSDKARAWCHKHFQTLGLTPRPSTETKFQRLLRKIR